MHHVRNIQFLRISLLSIIFSISLLSSFSVSRAFSGTCNVGNLNYSSTYTCNTWYTGSTPLFYSIETSTNIADANYNVAMQDNGKQIVIHNKNGLFWTPLYSLKIHYADGTKWGDGKSAYELATQFWFTGTITEWLNALEWPPWATGSVVFTGFTIQTDFGSGGSLSLTWNLTNDAELSMSGMYLPIVRQNGGSYYLDLYAILWGIVFLGIMFWLLKLTWIIR